MHPGHSRHGGPGHAVHACGRGRGERQEEGDGLRFALFPRSPSTGTNDTKKMSRTFRQGGRTLNTSLACRPNRNSNAFRCSGTRDTILQPDWFGLYITSSRTTFHIYRSVVSVGPKSLGSAYPQHEPATASRLATPTNPGRGRVVSVQNYKPRRQRGISILSSYLAPAAGEGAAAFRNPKPPAKTKKSVVEIRVTGVGRKRGVGDITHPRRSST